MECLEEIVADCGEDMDVDATLFAREVLREISTKKGVKR